MVTLVGRFFDERRQSVNENNACPCRTPGYAILLGVTEMSRI
jgi:hypothetical protein